MALSSPTAYDPTLLPALGVAGANQPLSGLTSADQLKQAIEALKNQDATKPQSMTSWAQVLAQGLRGAYEGYEGNQLAKQKAANDAVVAKTRAGMWAAPGDTSDPEGFSRTPPADDDSSTPAAASKADTSDASDGEDAAPVGGDKQAFIDSIMPKALEASKQTGLDPRLIVAQAAHESGWGQHAPGNNLFGIKSHGEPGGNTLATTEVVDGQPVRTSDSFRSYADPASSVQGYVDFVTSNPRYQPMLNAQGLEAQVAALGKSGYATDPKYGSKILQIAKSIPLGGAQTADAGQGDDEDTADATDTPPAAAANQVADASGTIVPQQAQGGDPNAGAPLPPPRSDLPPAALAGALKAGSGDTGAAGAPDPKALAAALAGQQDDTGGTYANLPGNQPVPAGQPGMPTLSAPPPGFSPAPVQVAANTRSLVGPETLNDGSAVPPADPSAKAAQPAPAVRAPASAPPTAPARPTAAQLSPQAQAAMQVLSRPDAFTPSDVTMAQKVWERETRPGHMAYDKAGNSYWIVQGEAPKPIHDAEKKDDVTFWTDPNTGVTYSRTKTSPDLTPVKTPNVGPQYRPATPILNADGTGPNPNAVVIGRDGMPTAPFANKGTTVNVGDKTQTSYNDQLVGAVAKTHAALANGVEGAMGRLNDINAMDGAVKRIQAAGGTTGFGKDELTNLQSAYNTAANMFGLQPVNIADQEALRKFNRTLAGAQAKETAGARVTNFEMSNFLKANAGLETSPEGNTRLLGIQRQIEERNVNLGQQIRQMTADAISNGTKVDAATVERTIRSYDNQNHITDPLTGQDLTKNPRLPDLGAAPKPVPVPGAGASQPSADGWTTLPNGMRIRQKGN